MNDSARDKDSHKVFVYGTLKGMDRPGRGRTKGVKYLGKAKTFFGTFVMHGGSFPVVNRSDIAPKLISLGTLAKYKGHVLGEVYEVSTDVLKGLDQYEGAPSFYEAEPVALVMEDGTDEVALMYVGKGVNNGLHQRPIISPNNDEGLYWQYPAEYA